MSYSGLQGLLRRRSIAVGFPAQMSFYAWRRGLATNIIRRDGVRTAAKVLGHRPGSNVVEEYYDNPTFDVDVFAFATGEAADHTSNRTNVALFRVVYDIPPQAEKKALDELLRQSNEYKNATTTGQ